MRHRTVGELMTRDVVSARPDTPFKELARLLSAHEVAAVPVVDATGRPIGVVSEEDLLRKATDRLEGVDGDGDGDVSPMPHLEAWERAKAEGARAEEIMSAPAVCVRPEWTVVEAARLMEIHGVKRLPVVDAADRLLGIVSRRDLLRVFLRTDEAIREEIRQEILAGTLGDAARDVTVEVADGQVRLGGSMASRRLVPVLVRLCRGVDGVVEVREHLAHDGAGPVREGPGI
ncbi:CBS domain-containing protein [Streptomyces sp. F63]|uniref:CBS domain-containing protein n=1 Tax=Streptomyces sp. F63 TaxID=2824887 RepID=UPI001B39454B|nr:CBS domain-containing protein [Streptomyces sp. F63]MBQ0984786.1 CBS domain-containing protein [Streptomyces sp. F63]